VQWAQFSLCCYGELDVSYSASFVTLSTSSRESSNRIGFRRAAPRGIHARDDIIVLFVDGGGKMEYKTEKRVLEVSAKVCRTWTQ